MRELLTVFFSVNMKYSKSEWFGFERYDFDFKGKNAIIVLPDCKANGKWLLKTYERLMEKPYADRIAGVFFAAGSTSEWGQL